MEVWDSRSLQRVHGDVLHVRVVRVAVGGAVLALRCRPAVIPAHGLNLHVGKKVSQKLRHDLVETKCTFGIKVKCDNLLPFA